MFKLLSKNRYNDLILKEDKLTSIDSMYNDLIRYYNNVSFSTYRSRYTSIQLNKYMEEKGEKEKLIEDLEGELNTLEQHEVNWLILMRYLSICKKENIHIEIDNVIDFILDLNKDNL